MPKEGSGIGELFKLPYGRFNVGDRVGLVEGTCYGKVAGFGCCGEIRVDLLCTHDAEGHGNVVHPVQVRCSAEDLEHID